MLIVHGYSPAWGTVDLSPFVVKLHTWLRLAELPYQFEVGNLRKMPAGKLPALTLEDGRLLGDSHFIIQHLSAQHGDPLREADWPAALRAQARAFRALLETDVYFAGVYQRWATEEGFALLAPELRRYLGSMGVPGLLQGFVAGKVRQKVIDQLKAQGTGRRPQAHIHALACEGMAALGDFLADKPWMLGERPSYLDATAFAFLHTQLRAPFASPVQAEVAGRANLVAYERRIRERFWPELKG
jgi:glutathione S-transferase